MATSKKRNRFTRFGDAVVERVKGLGKARTNYINKQEDARVAEGKAAQDKINAAAADKVDPVIKNPTDPNIKPITLANAKPSVVESTINLDVNPNFNPDTDAPVTRNTGSGQYEDQETRNENKRYVKKIPKKEQDPKPDFKFETAPGAKPASQFKKEKLLSGRGASGLNKDIFTGTNASTQYIDAKGNVLSAAQYHTQQNMDKAKTILADTKSGKYTPEVIKNATEFVKTGGVSEFLGEQAGVQAKSASEGLNKSVPYSADAAAIEAEPKLPVNDDLVLKDKATLKNAQAPTEAAASTTEAAAANAERRALLESITSNKNSSKAQKKAAAEALAEMAGLEPRASRSVFETFKDKVGLGQAQTVDTPAINSETHRPDGTKRQTLGQHLKPNGLPFGKMNLAGGAITAGMVPEMAARLAGSVSEGRFEEEAMEMVKQAPDVFADFLMRAVSEPIELAKEIGMDAVDLLVNLKSSVIAGLGSFNETVSGRNFTIPASGITGAPEQTTLDAALEQQPNIDTFARRGLGPGMELTDSAAAAINAGQKSLITPDSNRRVTDQVAGALDASRAQDGQDGQGAPATGLRQNQNVVPANNESFFVNNGAGGSGFEGLAGGTGGEAEGEKQFFHDLPQAFPEQQERGLGAAQNAITRGGNGRFNQTDPMANFVGEFARARSSYDQQALDQTERKNQATLSSAAGTAASTAATARQKADADLATELYEGLNNENGDVQRRTKGRIFQDFQTQRMNGNLERNSATFQAASSVITDSMVLADNEGLGANIWNTLITPFGSGQGLFDLFNGNASVNSGFPFSDIRFDGNEMNVRSTEKDAEGNQLWVSIGEFQDPTVLNFLRQNVKPIKK